MNITPAKIRTQIGAQRCDALAAQPGCLAAGGMESAMQQAIRETSGHQSPLTAATVRTIQICGSQPTAADLKA